MGFQVAAELRSCRGTCEGLLEIGDRQAEGTGGGRGDAGLDDELFEPDLVRQRRRNGLQVLGDPFAPHGAPQHLTVPHQQAGLRPHHPPHEAQPHRQRGDLGGRVLGPTPCGGVATATIPGQPAGSLVRYRLEASQGGLVGTWPRQGDGARYRGTTVARPAPSALPTFELFMPDDVYGVMANDLSLSGDDGYPVVLAFRGEVFDSSKIRVKGQTSRFFPKKKFKVILAPGYEIDDDLWFGQR